MFQTDLASARHLISAFAKDESAGYQLNADEALRVTVENRNGQVQMQAVVTDLASQRNREVFTSHGNTFIAAADDLARRLDAEAAPFSTGSDTALEAFSPSLASPDIKARISSASAAIAADPHFGLAHVARLELAAANGAGDLSSYLADANKDRGGFRPVDRARFDALVSRLTHAPLADQEKALAQVLRYVPNEADSNAVLGSLQFLSGNAGAGVRSLTRAIELNPADANYRRQLAVGMIESRKFDDAEKILAPLAKANPNLVPELAVTILLNGDAARANATVEQFLALRPPTDPLAILLRGTWLALGGQLNGAIALLQSANVTDPNVRAAFLSQIAIWQLATGNWTDARKSVQQSAAANRQSPLMLFAALLASADSDPETWRKSIEASPIAANASIKQAVLGYGFFLGKHYSEAADSWTKAVNASGGTDLRARAMLAASLDRAGRSADAKNVLVEPFVPEFTDLYAAISFGEMRRLLGLQMH